MSNTPKDRDKVIFITGDMPDFGDYHAYILMSDEDIASFKQAVVEGKSVDLEELGDMVYWDKGVTPDDDITRQIEEQFGGISTIEFE